MRLNTTPKPVTVEAVSTFVLYTSVMAIDGKEVAPSHVDHAETLFLSS